MTEFQLVQFALKRAERYLDTPYVWGGNNPWQGFDCSGFAQWYLKPLGLDPKGDQTAQALYEAFKDRKCEEITPGCLLFFGKSLNKISHVSIAKNELFMIEAGGGGPENEIPEDCEENGACVREMVIRHRKDLVAILKPDYQGVINEYSN